MHKSNPMTVEEAATRFPVGQRVTFFPVLPAESGETATVCSEPWALGHGDVVVKITSRSGGVSVRHLRAEPMLDQPDESA